MKHKVDVDIYGQAFSVASEDGDEYVRRVAMYVDQKMKEVTAATHTVGTLKVAILAALNIADEYHKLRAEHEALHQRIAQLSDALSDRLED